jgi:hypothetical protein
MSATMIEPARMMLAIPAMGEADLARLVHAASIELAARLNPRPKADDDTDQLVNFLSQDRSEVVCAVARQVNAERNRLIRGGRYDSPVMAGLRQRIAGSNGHLRVVK